MRVLEAVPSAVLPLLHKAVLRQHYALENGPEGCTMGATKVARRIGESVGNVKWARWQLQRMGVLRHAGGRGEVGRWYIDVPADCLPARTPSDDEMAACALRLADFLRLPVGPGQPAVDTDQPVPVGGDDADRLAQDQPVPDGGSHQQAETTQPVGPGQPLSDATGLPTPTGLSTKLPEANAGVGVVQVGVVGEVGNIQPLEVGTVAIAPDAKAVPAPAARGWGGGAKHKAKREALADRQALPAPPECDRDNQELLEKHKAKREAWAAYRAAHGDDA